VPALFVPAILVVFGVLVLVLFWRLGREGRRRYEYWKGVMGIWKRNRDRSIR